MVEETPYDELIDETCPSCRRTVPPGTTKCPHCGYQIREEEAESIPKVDVTPSKVRELESSSNRIWFGGVLILMSGILGALTGLYELIDPETMASLYSDMGIGFTTDAVIIFGAISLIFGLVAILGGVMTFRRKMWPLAVTGGLLGTIASGALFLGSILGIIGLAIVLTSKCDFCS
jgi:hypothetical protein